MSVRVARWRQGFTLLEVLVAVAVLTTALAAAIRIGSQAAGNVVELRERAYAGWVAENQIARVQSGIAPLEGPQTRSGSSDMGGMTWDWELSAEPADPGLELPVALEGLLELEVAVYHAGERDRPVAVREAWYRHAPERSGAEARPDG